MLLPQLERCMKTEEGGWREGGMEEGRNSLGVDDSSRMPRADVRTYSRLDVFLYCTLSISHNYECLGLLCCWDSKVIHELILVYLYLLFPHCCGKLSQLHNCALLWLFPKNKTQQRSLLPVSSPLNMSAAAIPQMAGGEGREGQLFNPLQCKHDPFEWRGISQDILVWADLPKQPWHCVCPSETNLWDARAADQFEFVQKQKVKGMFFSVECVVVCTRAQQWVI